MRVPSVGRSTFGSLADGAKRPSSVTCRPPVSAARTKGISPLTCQGGVSVAPWSVGARPRATRPSRRARTAAASVCGSWIANFTRPPVPPVGIIVRLRQPSGQSAGAGPVGVSSIPTTVVPCGISLSASASSAGPQCGLPRKTGSSAPQAAATAVR